MKKIPILRLHLSFSIFVDIFNALASGHLTLLLADQHQRQHVLRPLLGAAPRHRHGRGRGEELLLHVQLRAGVALTRSHSAALHST